MKITEGYSLHQIQGTYYLLPYGQNIVLFRNGLQLNHTGALIWKALEQGMTKSELLPYLAEYYHSDEADYPALQEDIEQFIGQLVTNQLITETSEPQKCTSYLKIGNLKIGYYGPDRLLHSSLRNFICEKHLPQQHWVIKTSSPEPVIKGELLIKTKELEIVMDHSNYILNLNQASQLTQMTLSHDGTIACFYCSPPYNDSLPEYLFHAFRHAYTFYAQRSGVFALHSASILYHDRVWLFSASSGTGKSTLAAHWKQLYQTPIINGDLNLIGFSDNTPIVFGLPWCGTSGIYSSGIYPLGGILLLKQGSENIVRELSLPERQLSVTARLISPTWTAELLGYNLAFTEKLVSQVPVLRFECLNEPKAAEALRQSIDELY